MLVKIKEFIKKRISKWFVLSFVVFISLVIAGASCVVFVMSAEKYGTSEMFISNSMCGIDNENKSEGKLNKINNYNIDEKVVAKMISETSTTSTYTDAVSNLNNFYNNLEDVDKYIYATNKFLCTGSNLTCAVSDKYSNIGLINIDEYNKIGGLNSYLGSSSSYFSMTENNSLVSNITSNGIEDVSYETNSGLRAVVYVQEDAKVTGSGSVSDPFVFVSETKGEIELLAWTLDGVEQTGSFPQRGDGYSAESVTCTNGSVATWDNSLWGLIFESVSTPTSCTVHFKEGTYLYAQIRADNPNVSTRTNFSTFTTSNNGDTIYVAPGQDMQDIYYFAGAVTNNYVKFGINNSGQELWWRIVRINEDNSVRLIYAGTSATSTYGYASSSSVYQRYDEDEGLSYYVGYMQGSGQHSNRSNSAIKTLLDDWYVNTLSNYDDYISKTAIYCNDRTVRSGYTWSVRPDDSFYYSAGTRYFDGQPTYICSNVNDKFTASSTTGNGRLTYPVALITLDEVMFAGLGSGGYISQNINTDYWTMTPNYYSSNSPAPIWSTHCSEAVVYTVSNTSTLLSSYTREYAAVRPVISLKSCVFVSGGNGTVNDPYTVEISNECAALEN